MQSSFEEEYPAVLRDIEWTIITVYRAIPALTDYQVDTALQALLRAYQHEKTGASSNPPELKSEEAQAVFTAVQTTCAVLLGRENAVDEDDQPVSLEPVPVEVIQACLKRLRKSVATWNKRGGTRGYLDYIQHMVI